MPLSDFAEPALSLRSLDFRPPDAADAVCTEEGEGLRAQRPDRGEIASGARTILVEDLATDGRSKVIFCQALRDAGAHVDHCFVLFYYDIFPKSRELMKELGVRLHHLTTWWYVLDVAKSRAISSRRS
jgi:orotate phosphoribosyltransferase